MRRFLWPLGLTALLLLSGCAEKQPAYGGKQRQKVFRTVVSLSPGATEIVAQKAPMILLIGRTAQCNYPVAHMSQPIVMNGVKPNYEKIAELAPDLIVYDVDLFSEADIAKLKDIGAELYGFSGATIDEYTKSLYRFGAFAGGETDISEYVSHILSAADEGRSSPLDPKPKVVVMLPGEGSEHMVAGLNSLQADVLRGCGAEPVGPDAQTFVPVNAEWLLSTNPDAILIAGDSKTIENDPRFKEVSAIKNGRVAHLNEDIALRRGTRLDLFLIETRKWLVKTQPVSGSSNGGAGS